MARHLRREHSLILIPHRSGYSTSGEVPTKQPAIVFSDSINAFKGQPGLFDYTATNGAIFNGFVRSLNLQIAGKTGIRINCRSNFIFGPERVNLISRISPFSIAPGPILTPLVYVSHLRFVLR